MLKLNGMFLIENIIVQTLMMTITCILAMILANFESNAELMAFSQTDHNLTVEHNIQANDDANICMFLLSISVLDNMTMKPITNALVEFKAPLVGNITNTTDQVGSTTISLSLVKELQHDNCMEALNSKGYSIEAKKEGYIGQGVGKIS